MSESPRQRWEQWQLEDRPTLGSRKPLIEYLVSNAQWEVETALIAHARGEGVPLVCVETLTLTVRDLAALVKEAAEVVRG